MSDTSYQGQNAFGFSMTFTPAGGAAIGTDTAQVLSATPAPHDINVLNFTPISGTNSGLEQITPGSRPKQDIKVKATYSKAVHAAFAALQGQSGTLVLTVKDAATYTYPNAILKTVAQSEMNDSSVMDDELTFSVPGMLNPYAANSTAVTVNFSQALATGAATIDMTNFPGGGVDGTGKKPTLTFTNPLTNANSITVAVGATNGYTGYGADFSITLTPGESVQLSGSSNIGSGSKTLDLSGTGAQALHVAGTLA